MISDKNDTKDNSRQVYCPAVTTVLYPFFFSLKNKKKIIHMLYFKNHLKNRLLDQKVRGNP